MFADDENDQNQELMTTIRERKDELEDKARSIGLYLEDWAPIPMGEEPKEEDDEENPKPTDILLHTIFTVGDLAFSDRVQVDESKKKLDEDFEAIMMADVYDKAIDAAEKIRRSGLIDDEED